MRSTIAPRFLRPEQIDAALAEIAEHARAQRLPVALAGGLAMQLYGSDRFTKDVDILADEILDGLPPGTPLSFGGVATTTTDGTVVIDVIVRDDDYNTLYGQALDQAKWLQDSPTPLRVVTREYMAAIKLAAGRPKDLDDLAYLVLSGSLDVPWSREIIKNHLGVYAAKEFDTFVLQVTTMGERV